MQYPILKRAHIDGDAMHIEFEIFGGKKKEIEKMEIGEAGMDI